MTFCPGLTTICRFRCLQLVLYILFPAGRKLQRIPGDHYPRMCIPGGRCLRCTSRGSYRSKENDPIRFHRDLLRSDLDGNSGMSRLHFGVFGLAFGLRWSHCQFLQYVPEFYIIRLPDGDARAALQGESYRLGACVLQLVMPLHGSFANVFQLRCHVKFHYPADDQGMGRQDCFSFCRFGNSVSITTSLV